MSWPPNGVTFHKFVVPATGERRAPLFARDWDNSREWRWDGSAWTLLESDRIFRTSLFGGEMELATAEESAGVPPLPLMAL